MRLVVTEMLATVQFLGFGSVHIVGIRQTALAGMLIQFLQLTDEGCALVIIDFIRSKRRYRVLGIVFYIISLNFIEVACLAYLLCPRLFPSQLQKYFYLK